MLTFSVFAHKYSSGANLVQEFKIIFFLVKFNTKTNSDMPKSMVVSILSALDWKQLPFLSKFCPKNFFKFKLKIGTYTNSNMKNSLVISFFVFSTGTNFFLEICYKNQNCFLELKFRTQINLNMQKSMIIFLLSFFIGKRVSLFVNLV